LLGSVLGITLCLLQEHFEIIRFDPQSFIIAAVPVSLAWPEVIAIILLTVLSSLLATIYPARRAARTLVSQALRTE
jgi:lipoprotein-releasing system permease protein